ncbi:MAG TPA: hypothetical protein EYP63_05145 [Desulfotomaculum sp.]|nr:hypothetical protein [Desulfotomaculum sp.]
MFEGRVKLRLLSYFKGYVSLLVEGRSIERFINMAVSRGIRFWDVRHLGGERILLRVRLGAVGALRHIARRTGSRFTVQQKAGLPFVIWRARQRKALYGGALFFWRHCTCSFRLSGWSKSRAQRKRPPPQYSRRPRSAG